MPDGSTAFISTGMTLFNCLHLQDLGFGFGVGGGGVCVSNPPPHALEDGGGEGRRGGKCYCGGYVVCMCVSSCLAHSGSVM